MINNMAEEIDSLQKGNKKKDIEIKKLKENIKFMITRCYKYNNTKKNFNNDSFI